MATDSVWARNWSQIRESKPVSEVLAGAGRVGVGDVAGVQMEGRVLAEQQAVVGEAVVADALVAEGREGERRLVGGGGGEGAEGARAGAARPGRSPGGRRRSSRSGPGEVGQLGVHVVLGVVAAGADTGRGVEGADLGVDLAGEVRGVGADPDERLLDRDRDLPGDGDLGARVGAVGEVAAEGGDEGAVDGLGRWRSGAGRSVRRPGRWRPVRTRHPRRRRA